MAHAKQSHASCHTEGCPESDNGHGSKHCPNHRPGAGTTEKGSLIAFRERKAARLAAKETR